MDSLLGSWKARKYADETVPSATSRPISERIASAARRASARRKEAPMPYGTVPLGSKRYFKLAFRHSVRLRKSVASALLAETSPASALPAQMAASTPADVS